MRSVVIYLFLSFSIIICRAQEKPIRIVFDVTSSDPSIHQSTMRHVKGMSSNYPQSEFEVVIYSGSIDMVLSESSSVKDDILSFKDNGNVSFKVCNMTMNRKGIEKGELIEGVDVVPDGILEIVTKQSEGWGYIKESH